jgi:hypothetical protein
MPVFLLWRGSVLCTHAGAMRLPHRDLIDAADRSRPLLKQQSRLRERI